MLSLRNAAMSLAFCILATPALANEQWGAIAIDVTSSSTHPDFSVSSRDSKKAAEQEAAHNCGRNCKVVVTYQACGAFASNGSSAGWGKGASKEIAEEGAMDSCGKQDCVMVVSDCN